MSVDLSGRAGTVTALETIPDALEVASLANITVVATGSLTARVQTSTRPATGGGSIVVTPSMNYIKVCPLYVTSGGAIVLNVIGWSFSKIANRWIPVNLAQTTATVATGGAITVAGTALFPGITFSASGAGDYKKFDGTTSCTSGFIIVDTCGSELIELYFTGTAAAANALVSFI
jgi:hypothetical protein